MKVEMITGTLASIILEDNIIRTKREADDLIAQLRAAAETVWPESAPCHGEPVLCMKCDGASVDESGKIICEVCNGSGENWKYEGGLVAKWYAGPLIEKHETEKNDEH